jgi:hypothetical protein
MNVAVLLSFTRQKLSSVLYLTVLSKFNVEASPKSDDRNISKMNEKEKSFSETLLNSWI